MSDLAAWLDNLDDDERAHLVALADEYAEAIATSAPLHDPWMFRRGLIHVLLSFLSEANGTSLGLRPRRLVRRRGRPEVGCS